jgi:hypothetical protein
MNYEINQKMLGKNIDYLGNDKRDSDDYNIGYSRGYSQFDPEEDEKENKLYMKGYLHGWNGRIMDNN